MVQKSIPAMVIRGGTSKGIFFKRSDLPIDESTWDSILLKTFGSPDSMQIDGIGGSHSTTSKAMIVSKSSRKDFDLDYKFAQVSVDNAVVDWGGNCGNLTFAIGAFAIESGIISSTFPISNLTLYNENTESTIKQSINISPDGLPNYNGDFLVHGVPGTGGPIRSQFIHPSGSITGKLFPTGSQTETIFVDTFGELTVSILDVTTPCVFIKASDLGISCPISPKEINSDQTLLSTLEYIRSVACERIGLVDSFVNATMASPGFPKVVLVDSPCDYVTPSGELVLKTEYDIFARIMSMQKAHPAYAVTGAMCTAAAALLPKTIPNHSSSQTNSNSITLGHPKGTMKIGVNIDKNQVIHTESDRTARPIMTGNLFY